VTEITAAWGMSKLKKSLQGEIFWKSWLRFSACGVFILLQGGKDSPGETMWEGTE